MKLLGIAALVVSLSASAVAQDKDWKKTLQSALEQEYPLTKMDNSLFAGRTSVEDSGGGTYRKHADPLSPVRAGSVAVVSGLATRLAA